MDEIRRAVEAAREEMRKGAEVGASEISNMIHTTLEFLERPSLVRVINATGVVLHTNLGRAPLARFEPLFGYTNLEYDLGSGKRGKRDVHIARLLNRLLGGPGAPVAGIAVNNNAAAIYLVLNELAAGSEVIVSRGELIEIGDGFRIPDIMRASGACLREVGTTNRTRIEDYREAVGERTRLLLRVHRSNFRIEGFTGRPELRELADLARERGLALFEDLGSGCIADLRPYGIEEPVVADSLKAGVDLVSFSGDKLLGGPQAGIVAGKPDLVARLRRNPMFRALRLDKLIFQSLETTLRALLLERYEALPALRMLSLTATSIETRAQRLIERLDGVAASIIEGRSVMGGGSTPGQSIATRLIAIATKDAAGLERSLRANAPPVIVRVENDRVLIDLRTVFEEEEGELVEALRRHARSR